MAFGAVKALSDAKQSALNRILGVLIVSQDLPHRRDEPVIDGAYEGTKNLRPW